MTLQEFAKLSGVIIESCDPEWGGKYAYSLEDHPNVHNCGYKTETAAYKAWLNGTFNKCTANAILKLLKQSEKE